MKRIQIIIPVLLGAFCTGCDLDIEPQDRYDQQTFWYSAKAAEGGLTGCYNALLENGIYGRAAVYWEDDATPNGYNFSNDDSWTTIANGAQTATSGGIIANRWSHASKGIGRCNTLLDNIDLNRELIEHPASTFYARVVGDSMADEGIAEGDILVVDRSIEPEHGDLAVCCLEGEFTLKRLRFMPGGGLMLMPSNRRYRPIEVAPGCNFLVWGVVLYTIKANRHRRPGSERW